jgi:AcrR family transcriptional regulator
MVATKRLKSADRREAILKAVRRVFADKGLELSTTRELAQAAGVSEALLYRHFPSKESLYSAMQISCFAGPSGAEIKRIMAVEPSTSALVIMVHFIYQRIIASVKPGTEDHVFRRLMLRSLLEKGDFARLFIKQVAGVRLAKLNDCVKAAIAAGDMVDVPVREDLRCWFAHHLAVMIGIFLLPETPVVDYKISPEKLSEQAVWFSLRGMGLKDEAIKRHYNPKALSMMGG